MHGRGLFAGQPIKAGEIVVVKGGYVLDWLPRLGRGLINTKRQPY